MRYFTAEKTGGVARRQERMKNMQIKVVANQVWVSGSGQQVVIREEQGVLSVEILPVDSVAGPVPAPAPVQVSQPVQAAAPVPASSSDDGLFQQLSELRRQIASELRVPSYVIFQDKSLHEMAAKMPKNHSEFGQIAGVGPSKREKYAEQFLAVINGAGAA